MRQGWMRLALCATLVLCAVALRPLAGADVASAASRSKSQSSAARSRNTLRQFTGWVTATDKQSVTVERRGKKPQTRVFTKHADMKTTGDLEKDAHVTVFYREEDGKAVAHRVIVRPPGDGSVSRR